MTNSQDKKIKSFGEIDVLPQSKRSVLVGGCFDILHPGHLHFLESAKKLGNFLAVMLESDDFIRKRKKREPVNSQAERAKNLAATEAVDQVIVLPYMETDSGYFGIIQLLKPKIIAVTKGDPLTITKKRQAEAVHARLETATDRLKGFSTSKILSMNKNNTL